MSAQPAAFDDASAHGRRRAKRRTKPSVPLFYPDWPLLHEMSAGIERALVAHARGTLLDVGCGEKPFEGHAPRVERWIGLDADSNSRADVHGTVFAIPLPDASVDTVLCTQVLEHVDDPARALAEMARVLRPGGALILTVPQYWPLHEEPYDFFRYTELGLRKLFAGAGLRVELLEGQGRGAIVAGQALNNALLCAGDTFSFKDELWFKAIKAPFYLVSNVLFAALGTVLRTKRDVLNHLVVAIR